MKFNLNDKEIQPQIISPKDWLLRHAEHRKINQVLRETTSNAPDLRVIFCANCQEIMVMGFVNESEDKENGA